MQVKLTIGERLKDLRVERKLTLEQLAAEVGISKSALGKYESDNGKDISPYSILLLADYYGVSCDYLMGRTETKNHPNTALHELHLSDASIDVLKAGKFNHRLLSELICHKDFQRFMLDAEIYVDRIADMRVKDMNAVLEAVRQMALMKNDGEENDLHLRTLEVAQIREDEYFGSLIADDLKGILHDIRSEHRPDTMTADEVSFAENIQNQLRDAMNFEGSSEERQIRSFLATFGIDYDKLSKEQFVSLIEILKLSKYLKNSHQPARKNDHDPRQGKTKETLKRGAALRRDEGFIYLSFLFRPVGFCFPKILHLCHLGVTKSACPTDAEKCLPTTICPHSRWRSQPLSSVSGQKRYNILDFAKQNRVPTGMLRAPIGKPVQRGAGLRWRPQSVKRFEALTEPTGETSLCNPPFPSRMHIQTAKRSLSCLRRKCKTAVISILRGMGITAVSF